MKALLLLTFGLLGIWLLDVWYRRTNRLPVGETEHWDTD